MIKKAQNGKVTMAQRDSIKAANRARIDSTLNSRATKAGYKDVASYMKEHGYDQTKKEKYVGIPKSELQPIAKKPGPTIGEAISKLNPFCEKPGCIFTNEDKSGVKKDKNGGTMKKAQTGDTLSSVKVNRPETKTSPAVKANFYKVKKGEGTEKGVVKKATRGGTPSGEYRSSTYKNPNASKPGDTISSVKRKDMSSKYGGVETHKYAVREAGGVKKGSTTTRTAPSGKTQTSSTTKFKKK